MVTEQNWQFSQYIQGEMRAFISVEYSLDLNEKFYLTTEKNDRPYSQMEFPELMVACEALNQKYSSWRFIELPSFQEESKCSTCG